jgi:hypothetical protein
MPTCNTENNSGSDFRFTVSVPCMVVRWKREDGWKAEGGEEIGREGWGAEVGKGFEEGGEWGGEEIGREGEKKRREGWRAEVGKGSRREESGEERKQGGRRK